MKTIPCWIWKICSFWKTFIMENNQNVDEKYWNCSISEIPSFMDTIIFSNWLLKLGFASSPNYESWFITSLAVGQGGSSLVSSKSNVSLLLSLNCNILVVLVSSSIPPLPLMVLLMTAAHRGAATQPLRPTTIIQKLNGSALPRLQILANDTTSGEEISHW